MTSIIATSGGKCIQSGLLGTPIKISVQLVELSSNAAVIEGEIPPWTADSINSMYQSRKQSSSESAPSSAQAQALKNLIGLPRLHQVCKLDLWLSSSMPLTAACQTAAKLLGMDPSRYCAS